jgi:hypothetical protein
VLSKALGGALFWATFGGTAVFVYLGAELLACLLVKLLRHDMVYWLAVEGFTLNAVVAVLFRLVAKIICDFTGFLALRHPFEFGGLHFTLSLLWSQLSAVISVVLYQRYYDEVDEDVNGMHKISATALYSMILSLVVVWLVSLYGFVRNINPKYLHTFVGTMTGSQYSVHLFRTGDDYVKIELFVTNVLYWESIRDEVIDYTHKHWSRWNAEQPEWFTEQFISTVPDAFIPVIQKDRKRSSVFRKLIGLPYVEQGLTNRSKNTSKVLAVNDITDTGDATGSVA